MKTTQLKVRPVFVYTADHVRAHVFLCMLAYYLEWHLRQKWAPMLFEDDDRAAARVQRTSPVAKADVSDGAKRKARRKITATGQPVHSLRTLLDDLATLTRIEVTPPRRGWPTLRHIRNTDIPAGRSLAAPRIEPAEGDSSSATG